MVKYFVNEEERKVVAVLQDTQWDAYNKICKMMRNTDFCVVPRNKYMMNPTYRAIVTCDEKDEFNVEVGKQIAKERVLEHYYEALDKRLNHFKDSLLNLKNKTVDVPVFENNA
jgi:hypothetical protein